MPTNTDSLTIEEHLCFAVYSANMAINRLYRPILERMGLTYPQYLVLRVLWAEDHQPVGAIADRLSLESSTATPLIKRLEAAGLVSRRRDPDDERQVIVSLTEEGRSLQHGSGCLTETLLQRSRLDVADIVRLNGEIGMLRDAVSGALDKV